MASYHLSVKTHTRSKNANGVALASYRSGERLFDERQQSIKDCRKSHKSDVLYTELFNSNSMNRERLWNAAEMAETRKNSVVAREIEIALPVDISDQQKIDLAREFSSHLSKKYNCAIDLAVHAPDADGDQRNYHAHILMTTREMSPSGLSKKWRHLDQPKGRGRIELNAIRETFEQMQNKALEKAGRKERVSAKRAVEQDRPKKYRALPFKKYQVMRREGRVEDYKSVSGEKEFEVFKERKELEIEDLMEQISQIEETEKSKERKFFFQELAEQNRIKEKEDKRLNPALQEKRQPEAINETFRSKLKRLTNARIHRLATVTQKFSENIRTELEQRKQGVVNATARKLVERIGRMAAYYRQQTQVDAERTQREVERTRRETKGIRRYDQSNDEHFRGRVKGLRRKQLRIAIERTGEKIERIGKVIESLHRGISGDKSRQSPSTREQTEEQRLAALRENFKKEYLKRKNRMAQDQKRNGPKI